MQLASVRGIRCPVSVRVQQSSTHESESLRLELRRATEAVHEAAHRSPALVDLLAGRLNRTRYAALLFGLHRFHADAAPAVADADHALGVPDPGHAHAARVRRLEDDLRHVSTGSPERDAVGLSFEREGGWALGFAYAVNGSSIGGRMMHGALDPLFGAEQAGRTFFRGPPDEASRWRDFCRRLDAAGGDPAVADAAVSGARCAFAHFRSCVGSA